ncbi:hypothetical protein CesoFtcFv8_008576 [Champsocephalus esox]|uniref:CTNNB1 binding N-teminal domain-containing protein n=1 Tax=Champsocephalus esox TaxID=159716 RepID=A0AAN8CBQ3_9TELE|nr:hypothetical protein CesoFtcFv8_008576 [Champsocephalus esox]
MPQLSGGSGDPELCATDEMIAFKDEGDPHKEQISPSSATRRRRETWQTSSHLWSTSQRAAPTATATME